MCPACTAQLLLAAAAISWVAGMAALLVKIRRWRPRGRPCGVLRGTGAIQRQTA